MNLTGLGVAFRKTLAHVPRSRLIFKICRMYLNACNGDDCNDFRLNGEGRVLTTLLPTCQVVFDVGANVGDWAKLALGINPASSIHAFEPSKDTFDALRARHFGENVTLNQLGLSSTNRTAVLHQFGSQATANSLYEQTGVAMLTQSGAEEIRLATLDDYCATAGVDRIDYLKIDVEGHELDVLRGARRMLSERRIGLIQLEYSFGYIAARAYLKDVFTELNEVGFRAHKILPKQLLSAPSYDERHETFRVSNWLFAMPDDPRLSKLRVITS